MDKKPGPRWFHFKLSTLFVLVTACAFLAFIGPPMVGWLFPPEPVFLGEPAMNDPEFRKLIWLIEQTLRQPESSDGEPKIVITHGAGLTIE
jgi:hypothetical protein